MADAPTATEVLARTPRRSTKKSILFQSKYQGLRIVLDPVYVQRGPQGQEIGRTKGSDVIFENKIAWVDPEQAERLRTLHLDDNGDRKPDYQGSEYGIHFWEVGDEPGALKPSVSERLDVLTRAATRRDEDAIKQVLADEADTHSRAEVLDAGKAALETLEELKE